MANNCSVYSFNHRAVERTMAKMSFEESELPFRVDLVDGGTVELNVQKNISIISPVGSGLGSQ